MFFSRGRLFRAAMICWLLLPAPVLAGAFPAWQTLSSPQQEQLARWFRGSFAQLPPSATAAPGPTPLKTGTSAPAPAVLYAASAQAYEDDAQYACRQPFTAALLASVWQRDPPSTDCGPLPFLLMDEKGQLELRRIDPARVQALHLLFAGSDGGTISRFGHVMLRLVVCDPQRSVVDAHCEQDLFEHVTLGFKAGIDELDISLWKGLTGGYPVRLYAKSFMDSYREYTIDEFRPVYSLPLRLQGREKDLLLRALSQVHWSYQNDYRFFTRNCTTELQWLLAMVGELALQQPVLPRSRYRPDRLFADARASALFDAAVLDDPGLAEKRGNYFPSAENYYRLALDTLTGPQQRVDSPEAWRAQSASLRRERILLPLMQGDGRTDKEVRQRELQAGLVLESWVERRLRRQLLVSLTIYYGSLLQSVAQQEDLFTGDERQLMTDCLSAVKAVDQTGRRPDGLPLQGLETTTVGCDIRSPALMAVMKKFFDAFPVSTDGQRDIRELEATVENIRLLAAAYDTYKS